MKSKLLIVDDEESIRDSLFYYFSDKGYNVMTAMNGFEALNLVGKEDFDMVISDIRMERKDGLTFVKEMKSFSTGTPIVLITAFSNAETAIEALRYGVADYIPKPFDIEKLGEKVANILHESKMNKEESFLQKYKELKLDFITRFSHELRTPLTPVEGYTQMLLKESLGKVNQEQSDALKAISKNTKRLKRVIEDLIILYSFDYMKDKPAVDKYTISELLEDAAGANKELLESMSHRLVIDIEPGLDFIYCDAALMKRVFYHLLNNAIRFSPARSEIKVKVRKTEYQNQTKLNFCISDKGPGIRKNKRQIFFLFYDLQKANEVLGYNEVKGFGLGLTLVRCIVEAHGGKIWIENNPDEPYSGTTVCFMHPYIETPGSGTGTKGNQKLH